MALFSVHVSWHSLISPIAIVVLASVLAYYYLFRRPPFPKDAPRRTSEDWPIIGSPRFFTQHGDFNLRGLAISASNNFSFYLGKHQVVSIGANGRKTYFENSSLNAGEGYATLFTGTPRGQGASESSMGDGHYQSKFGRTVIQLLKKTYLSTRTPVLAADVKSSMESLVRQASCVDATMKPFETVHGIVWQQTLRLVGADEIAASADNRNYVLRLFEDIAESASPLRVMFPMLPTLGHVKRMVAGARLFGMLQGFVNERRTSGRKENDALQFLMDSGEDMTGITGFIAGGLFAGQLNTSVNAAWLLIYLATNEEWHNKVRQEVDAALERRGVDQTRGPEETTDILSRLSLDEWVSEFPLIDNCLKETIRFQLPGTLCRKNTGNSPLPIVGSNDVIPRDAFVVYLTDNCHFNPDIYSEPLKWDPDRYSAKRAEDTKVQYAYMGWGVGRHSCLGMTAAKMEITMVVAFFVALFDFHLLDEQDWRTGEVEKRKA
ncbi:Obtusifoliol 14-alpha demethylase [Colletotrichum tanaceti]|uniref:Obtusifoliol 14-alpha demethylase n=1 Tax=Colletotrichum tanaceti TaxID=1306861 RepID=A0A4U6XI85_9PEZI|nr:Obtusifoliol 14-alpha demethylase [Colletotrichum tanaceti]